MANQKFYQQTGNAGGLGNDLAYIDSHRGSDITGDGTYLLPFKTIQKALDLDAGADLVVSGVFAGVGISGNWVGEPKTFIAEGDVYFDGTGITTFFVEYAFNQSFYVSNKTRFSNGRFTLSNYINHINIDSTSFLYGIYDVSFINCLEVANGSGRYNQVAGCLFFNSSYNPSKTSRVSKINNNTFINSSIYQKGTSTLSCFNNYFNLTSKLGYSGLDVILFNYNFFEGTLTGKINLGSGNYDNIEAVQLAEPTLALNDLPSTTLPLLNSINSMDFTLQEASPLVKAAMDGKEIGFAKAAKSVGASDAAWTTLVNIDNSTTPGEAVLSGGVVGTAESIGIEISSKAREWARIGFPDLEFDSALGEMIGNLAADNIPYLMDIEIKYSLDDITYNTNWLRMATATKPMHDTVNDVGTDDALYSEVSAVPVVARYVKYLYTLRSNETPV